MITLETVANYGNREKTLVIFLELDQSTKQRESSLLGDFLALAGAIMYASYVTLLKIRINNENVL